MPEHGFYLKGQWNAQCDICGLVFKSGELKEAWDKSMRCSQCWEPRHPQDFVKGVQDNMSTPWARPIQLPDGITALVAPLTAGAAAFSSVAGGGATFPSPNNGIGQYFLGTLYNVATPQVNEVIRVRSRVLDIFSLILRGQNGTNAVAWPAGTQVSWFYQNY